MKQTILFLVVLTICGSLTKPPVQRACGSKIRIEHYWKGKLSHIDVKESIFSTGGNPEYVCHLHPRGDIRFHSDSISYKVHIPKQQ